MSAEENVNSSSMLGWTVYFYSFGIFKPSVTNIILFFKTAEEFYEFNVGTGDRIEYGPKCSN